MKRKVLIITYYWPPSGGPGVQRSVYFVKYLREFGWEPIVYTVEKGEFPDIDHSFDKEIPSGVQVLRTPIWEPYHLFKAITGRQKEERLKPVVITEKSNRPFLQKLSVWIRGNFFIPDARKFWIKPSIKYLHKYLSSNPVDAIFTTSPPQSMHLIGMGVKQKTGIPWIADFRDPWSRVSYYEDLMLTKWADQKHKRLEKNVLHSANSVTTVSWKWKRDFEKIGGREVQVITNGFDFDEKDLSDPIVSTEKKFTLLYIGSLSLERNPIEFWRALGAILQELPELKNEFELILIGNIEPTIFETLDNFGLTEIISKNSYIPHELVKDYLKKASALLLIGIPNVPGVLPGKIFEYLSVRKPIISISPKNSDAEKILNETGAGRNADYGDFEKFKAILNEMIQLHKKGKLQLVYGNPRDILQYSRKELTKKLASLLDKII